MPTYEYKCADCGSIFEKFQSMSDTPLQNCPYCNGRIQRLISGGGGIILRGPSSDAPTYAASNTPTCGRDRPCCGRDTPCDRRPCES